MDDDGTAYVWDSTRRCFVPQQMAAASAPDYGLEDMTFPDEDPGIVILPPPVRPQPPLNAEDGEQELTPEQIAAELEAERLGLKRRRAELEGAPASVAPLEEDEPRKQKSKTKAAPQPKVRLCSLFCPMRRATADTLQCPSCSVQANTSVYVTGIPDDASEAELAAVFSKCGLLRENDDGTPKVRLYRDAATGAPKGDALVTYLKEPSVVLALSILDGAQFRPGSSGPAMSVAVATFSNKEGKGDAAAGGGGQTKGAGGGGAKGKGGQRKAGGGPGAAAEKALGWDGFDDVLDPRKVVVILRGMFTPAEMQLPGAVDDLTRDVASECGKFGHVERVRVFEFHPEGVVSVKFRLPDAADACRVKMHGRWFGGSQLVAAMYDGKTDLDAHRPRSSNRQRETEEEQAARLERFARELEKEEQTE